MELEEGKNIFVIDVSEVDATEEDPDKEKLIQTQIEKLPVIAKDSFKLVMTTTGDDLVVDCFAKAEWPYKEESDIEMLHSVYRSGPKSLREILGSKSAIVTKVLSVNELVRIFKSIPKCNDYIKMYKMFHARIFNLA